MKRLCETKHCHDVMEMPFPHLFIKLLIVFDEEKRKFAINLFEINCFVVKSLLIDILKLYVSV